MKPNLLFPCNLCGSAFQIGGGKYEGHNLPHYKMWLCRRCYSMNWDGISPLFEKSFEKHLLKEGLDFPERNSNGWYPR